jgi:cation:H+ antiporter
VIADILPAAGLILVGLVGLIVGGELLVRGASGLAAAARISPLVIGITVVSFGTSAPELAVTVQAALADAPALAVGNVVGSNIANILLILGVAALITPLAVQSRIVKVDLPLVLACSAGLWVLSLDGRISGLDGLGMMLVLGVYLAWTVVQGRADPADVQDEFTHAAGMEPSAPDAGAGALAAAASGRARRLLKQALFVIGGLLCLVLAARAMVSGAGDIARQFGVSELIIGLTIIAIGTSLPELVASVLASWRGQADIAVGNAVGSNLFNILAVLGIGAMVAPGGIPVHPEVLTLDLPIMIAVALFCIPLFFTGCRITRLEGAVMVGYFVAYNLYLFMGATDAAYTRSFEVAMTVFVMPITALAIAFSVLQALRRRRAERLGFCSEDGSGGESSSTSGGVGD